MSLSYCFISTDTQQQVQYLIIVFFRTTGSFLFSFILRNQTVFFKDMSVLLQKDCKVRRKLYDTEVSLGIYIYPYVSLMFCQLLCSLFLFGASFPFSSFFSIYSETCASSSLAHLSSFPAVREPQVHLWMPLLFLKIFSWSSGHRLLHLLTVCCIQVP